MNQEQIIIITLIVIILYLAYQNQGNKSVSPNIKQLQTELKHYQSLYQKRVEKDLNAETLNSD